MFPQMPDRKELGRSLALSQIGMEMVAPIVGGLLLDHYLGWRPWATVAGAVLGMCGALLHLVHLLNQPEDKNTSSSDREVR